MSWFQGGVLAETLSLDTGAVKVLDPQRFEPQRVSYDDLYRNSDQYEKSLIYFMG